MVEVNSSSELKSILLDIMVAIHDFCEKNRLTYFLWGGTLLGAVRHHGFIPWDDDIDIAMPRKDYQYFIKYFDTDKYSVYSCETNKLYPYFFAKAYDKRTLKREPIYTENDFEIGINVDIFPLDKVPHQNKLKYLEYKRSLKLKEWNISILNFDPITSPKKALRNLAVLIMHHKSNKLSRYINFISQSGKNKQPDKIMLFADSNLNNPLIMDISWFNNKTLQSFEQYKFYIPIGYDPLLHLCYGDYMTPPPKEKQITHHNYVAFWRE